MRRGQYIGVTDEYHLEVCSLRQTADASVKARGRKAFYYGKTINPKLEGGKAIAFDEWAGALSFGVKISPDDGEGLGGAVGAAAAAFANAGLDANHKELYQWEGAQFSTATSGWSVKVAIFDSYKVKRDGWVTKVRISFKSGGNMRNFKVFTCQRNGVNICDLLGEDSYRTLFDNIKVKVG